MNESTIVDPLDWPSRVAETVQQVTAGLSCDVIVEEDEYEYRIFISECCLPIEEDEDEGDGLRLPALSTFASGPLGPRIPLGSRDRRFPRRQAVGAEATASQRR